MARAALWPRRQTDRFRKADGSAGPRPDLRVPQLHRGRGRRTWLSTAHQLHPPHTRNGNGRRSPAPGLPGDRRPQESCGLHDRRDAGWLDASTRYGRSWSFAMRGDWKKTTYDPELQLGARNAVNVCLRVKPSERVTVITDHACYEIAASLVAELEKTGCE